MREFARRARAEDPAPGRGPVVGPGHVLNVVAQGETVVDHCTVAAVSTPAAFAGLLMSMSVPATDEEKNTSTLGFI